LFTLESCFQKGASYFRSPSVQQSKKPADDLTKTGKKGEAELSEEELKRATGGGKPIHKV
jgi:hypothetical protein